VFVPGESYQPSSIFASKARTRIRPDQNLPTNIRIGWNIFVHLRVMKIEMFVPDGIKNIFSMNVHNKLECLSLASLSRLFQCLWLRPRAYP